MHNLYNVSSWVTCFSSCYSAAWGTIVHPACTGTMMLNIINTYLF